MIERLVLTNLRRAQAFDANLRQMSGIEKLIRKFVDVIMFNPNPVGRVKNINQLKKEILSHVETQILPQANRIGTTNAKDIAAKLPAPVAPLSIQERQLALFEGTQRAEQRLAIVRSTVDASGSTLEARLTRHWLEPSEGNAENKVKRLKEIHARLEGKRTTYETNLKAFNAGETKKRPAKPNLDYMSEMNSTVKKEVRTQARRAGTDAETAVFRNKGYSKLVWVAPNGSVACPDCAKRQNVSLTIEDWERVGRPGSGLTVCGENCFCLLLPEESIKVSPSLLNRHNTHQAGPLTDDLLLNYLNKNRIPAKTS